MRPKFSTKCPKRGGGSLQSKQIIANLRYLTDMYEKTQQRILKQGRVVEVKGRLDFSQKIAIFGKGGRLQKKENFMK